MEQANDRKRHGRPRRPRHPGRRLRQPRHRPPPRWSRTTCRKGAKIVLHTENGLLGMGPRPAPGEEDPELINAGKQPVTTLPGASFFHHADSFAMMRGGHLDICVLGGFEVSVTGDLANWHTGKPDAIPAVGGAMDLAIGAKRVFVLMEALTKDGRPKLVRECSYPLTGKGCVSRVYTDLATFRHRAGGGGGAGRRGGADVGGSRGDDGGGAAGRVRGGVQMNGLRISSAPRMRPCCMSSEYITSHPSWIAAASRRAS